MDSTGLKQATGPGNRTQDLQNDRAVKSGVRALDLQEHRAHKEHEKYTYRACGFHVEHAGGMTDNGQTNERWPDCLNILMLEVYTKSV